MSVQERRPAIFSLASAIVASVCCVLPLLALTLGIAGFGLAGTVGRYSPVFIALGGVGLGLAYTLHFRERRRGNALGCQMVGQGWNKVFLGVSTVLMLGFVGLKFLPISAQEPLPAATGLEERLVLHVDGMT